MPDPTQLMLDDLVARKGSLTALERAWLDMVVAEVQAGNVLSGDEERLLEAMWRTHREK